MVKNNVGNIFVKLSFTDQMELNKYINRKINEAIMKQQIELEKEAGSKEKHLMDLNEKTWEKIQMFLHRAMRKHRISEERIKKIEHTVLELSNESKDKLLINKGEVK